MIFFAFCTIAFIFVVVVTFVFVSRFLSLQKCLLIVVRNVNFNFDTVIIYQLSSASLKRDERASDMTSFTCHSVPCIVMSRMCGAICVCKLSVLRPLPYVPVFVCVCVCFSRFTGNFILFSFCYGFVLLSYVFRFSILFNHFHLMTI